MKGCLHGNIAQIVSLKEASHLVSEILNSWQYPGQVQMLVMVVHGGEDLLVSS